MVEIGRFNRLRIAKERSVGYFFDGGEAGDILMPKRHQPEQCEVGDELDVFIFLDADERLTATVHVPKAQVGEVAWLKVVDIHRVGAFLDWGVTKDLLVPFREQAEEMQIGKSYLVYILLDENQRIIGSSRLDDYLEEVPESNFKTGQEVELTIAHKTERGYKAVVDNAGWGMLYDSEVFQPLKPGQKLKGYIRKQRDDGKLDLSLQRPGYHKGSIEAIAQQILARIKEAGGFLELTDKSPPEVIHAEFQISKKLFKQAVGKLYKERLIMIEPQGLRRVSKK